MRKRKRCRAPGEARPVGCEARELVRADFTAMREAGIDHPLMGEIESTLDRRNELSPAAP